MSSIFKNQMRSNSLIQKIISRLRRDFNDLAHPVTQRHFAKSPSEKINRLIDSSTLTEKIIFFVFTLALAFSSIYMLYQVNEKISVSQPAQGGSFTEGVVGSPRFINPLLAVSEADKDLVSLVYSGLLKRLPSGKIAYDLAESIDISDDARVFTVTLRDDVTFHDGTPVTSRDVAFTVERAKDPQLRSPLQGDWVGVNVNVINQRQIQFELDEPYSPFIENLTVGILPSHVWGTIISSQFASSPHNDATPVGSGPYKVENFSRQQETALTEYKLTAFDNYSLGRPYISSITIKSFANNKARMEALRSGEIDSAGGLDPSVASALEKEGWEIETTPLPRMFGVFLNQNENNIFTDQNIREALSKAVDKEMLVEVILDGYGSAIETPSPKNWVPTQQVDFSSATTSSSTADEIKSLLSEAGYETDENGRLSDENDNPVHITISTSDTRDLTMAAQMLEEWWGQLGIEVTTHVYPASELNRNIIRQRDYEALLFGEVIGPARNFYPFWHSSQQDDPGLNIAQYANIEVDALLEQARGIVNYDDQGDIYQDFLEIVYYEQPAVFLYTPYYIYAAPQNVRNVNIGERNTVHNRFSLVHQWYIDTDKVWLPFAKETNSRIPVMITD